MRCKHPPGVHIFNRIKQVAKRIANIRFARDNRGTAMYRIMIVEDDEVIARAVQQSLVSWGMLRSAYRIFPAFSPNLP